MLTRQIFLVLQFCIRPSSINRTRNINLQTPSPTSSFEFVDAFTPVPKRRKLRQIVAVIRHPFPYLRIFTFPFISLSKVTNKLFPKAYDTKAQQIHKTRHYYIFPLSTTIPRPDIIKASQMRSKASQKRPKSTSKAPSPFIS